MGILLVIATANAVNLTDGLDGLAGGSSAIGFSAFVIIGYWLFRHPEIYQVSRVGLSDRGGSYDRCVHRVSLVECAPREYSWEIPAHSQSEQLSPV